MGKVGLRCGRAERRGLPKSPSDAGKNTAGRECGWGFVLQRTVRAMVVVIQSPMELQPRAQQCIENDFLPKRKDNACYGNKYAKSLPIMLPSEIYAVPKEYKNEYHASDKHAQVSDKPDRHRFGPVYCTVDLREV